MIRFSITTSTGAVPVIFSKFFAAAEGKEVLEASRTAEVRRVVFLDTGATPVLADTIRAFREEGVEVVVRDHHRGEGRTPEAAEAIEALLGERATIKTRKEAPACALLVEKGEFKPVVTGMDALCAFGVHMGTPVSPATLIVADPDADGLLAAMKAAGVVYDRLDEDAAVLDGPRAEQTAERLSPLALLLVKGMATLPPFNPERPAVSEEAKGKLFAEFVAAVSGDEGALKGLTDKVQAYEVGVKVAEELLLMATEPAPGVLMVDAVGKPRFDLATLASRLEARPGCRVTVVRKSDGPIAGKHGGVQYSLAVAKTAQVDIDLRVLVPAGAVSSPEAGLISNTSFLLHCSETMWNETVLPALRARFAF